MSKLILLRHGQSTWNELNLFTGWVDVPLSTQGIEEALAAGKLIKDIPIDYIVTSTLIRAQMTAMLAMTLHSSGKVPVILHSAEGRLAEWSQIQSEDTKQQIIPVIRYWELNERMYGDLQGLNKAETAQKFGDAQVKIWRRSFDIAPPNGESLLMTAKRAIPCFEEKIIPVLAQGLNVFVSAHGNSLRSIIMDMEGLSKDEVVNLEIATGAPIIYNYDQGVFTRESIRTN
ncbi:MAG: 2,3-bisphosphoglycerate-dependent phosphoglycerate mutase [Parachlamydiaceae bacterium]|nr:2,3-bisphosphoglycerate-dependent phosphoglycerate mutase [Parachlamydiaceae bacterium]